MFFENQAYFEENPLQNSNLEKLENQKLRVSFADPDYKNVFKKSISKPFLLNNIEQPDSSLSKEEKCSSTSLLNHIKVKFGGPIDDLNNKLPNGIEKKFVENLISNKVKYNQLPSNQDSTKYTNSFFNDPSVQEELFQENLKAQILMSKYFNKEHTQSAQPVLNTEVEEKALNLIRHVSSMLKKFNPDSEEKSQPTHYDSLINKEYKTLPNRSGSVKYLKPFTYHKNNESTTEVRLSDFDFNAKVEESSECIQFLDTKFTHSGNKILYKNKSENLENDLSADNLAELSNSVIPERLMSLRNMYSCFHLQNFSRYTSQKTLCNNSSTFGVRLKANVEVSIDDDDYKKWLKRNNFVKYTDLSVTSDSVTNEIINCSISERRNKIPPKTSFTKKKEIPEKKEICNYDQYLELILYEHIVVLNAIQFFSYLFCLNRIKQLTLPERFLQILFFIFCYYVTVFLDELGIDKMVQNLDIESLIIK